MQGFETIGNASLIAYDGRPVLATDPWLEGDPYFGSWGLPYEIPDAQRRAIENADFIWLSHGHPDHLDASSLEKLQGRKILLPDHVGNRIRDDLRAGGFDVTVLKERRWVSLSDNIRVLCVSDYFQDAVLLVDVGGTLLVNLNDATDRGWGRFVRKLIKGFPRSFLLKLFGYGDVDMINFFDEDGVRIPPRLRTRPIGEQVEFYADLYGVTDVVPFSCFHRYQRSDSAWANEHTTPLSALSEGFRGDRVRLHDAFVRFDCDTGQLTSLHPRAVPPRILKPKEFGDDWHVPLEREDHPKLAAYFQGVESLADEIDFVRLRVGGVESTVDLGGARTNRGLTFETPRASLMTAVEYRVFDDLLIGNFARTTLHGDWNSLHPFFTPYVAKFGDNGRARSKSELRDYFREYRKRAPFDYVLHRFEQESERRVRGFVRADTPAFQLAKRAYVFLKGGRRSAPPTTTEVSPPGWQEESPLDAPRTHPTPHPVA